MERKKKMYAGKIKIIATTSAVVAVMLALIITNFFIPVIYFTAYVHLITDKNPQGQMRVRYIDVGFGDCSLVELPDGKTLLIDGGTGTYGNVYKLLDTLNKSKIDKIDYLVCSSVKSEHCGALAEIVKYKKIGAAYIPQVLNLNITDEYASFYSALQRSGAKIEIADFGKGVYNSDCDYFFIILSPMAMELSECEYHLMNRMPTEENINNASIVVWLQYAGRGFMFLGDATPSVQSGLANLIKMQNGEFLIGNNKVKFAPCAVIKAPNHCARDYTQPTLYDVILPEAAVISVGRNAKSCPSNIDISNLQLYVGNNLFRTDLHGTITAAVNAETYMISKEK